MNPSQSAAPLQVGGGAKTLDPPHHSANECGTCGKQRAGREVMADKRACAIVYAARVPALLEVASRCAGAMRKEAKPRQEEIAAKWIRFKPVFA